MDGEEIPAPGALVSAVIPAYNAEGVIAGAIESVLAQSYSPIEIIVVNDCSTDGTAEVVGRYADRGVRLINLPRNGGASVCRNEGIAAARGPFMAFLDSDDEWMPGKITAQVANFLETPGCSLSVCDGKWVDPENNVIDIGLADAPDHDDGDAWRLMLSRSFIHTSCVLTTKALLEKLGGFDTNLVVAEDWDLWIRLGLEGRYAFAREILVTVHVTPGSLMKREAKNIASYLLPMIDRHLTAQRSRFTASERRRIWCIQLERVGRAVCDYGSYWEGAAILFRAMLLGHVTWAEIYCLIYAFPPISALRGGPRPDGLSDATGRRAVVSGRAVPVDEVGTVMLPHQRFQAITTLIPVTGRSFIEVTNSQPLFREWAQDTYDNYYTCAFGEPSPNGRFDCVVFSDFSMGQKLDITTAIESYLRLLTDNGVLVFALSNIFDKNNVMKLRNIRAISDLIKMMHKKISFYRYLKFFKYEKYATTFKKGDLFALVSVKIKPSREFYFNININNDQFLWHLLHPIKSAVYSAGINGYFEKHHLFVIRR